MNRENGVNDTNVIKLPNDIVGFLGSYCKPSLWMYWVYDINKSCRIFDEAQFVEAESYDDVCIHIFNTHIAHFIRYAVIQRPHHIIDKIYEDNKNDLCRRMCNNRTNIQSSLCLEHFPTNQMFLKYFSDKEDKIRIIDDVMERPVYTGSLGRTHGIMIKQVNW